jgi:phage-related protein
MHSVWRNSAPGIRMPSHGKEKEPAVEDHRGDTYRAIYTLRFTDAVYVLHAFQKKSKSGIKTDQTDVKLIAERLKRAKIDYESGGTS